MFRSGCQNEPPDDKCAAASQYFLAPPSLLSGLAMTFRSDFYVHSMMGHVSRHAARFSFNSNACRYFTGCFAPSCLLPLFRCHAISFLGVARRDARKQRAAPRNACFVLHNDTTTSEQRAINHATHFLYHLRPQLDANFRDAFALNIRHDIGA